VQLDVYSAAKLIVATQAGTRLPRATDVHDEGPGDTTTIEGRCPWGDISTPAEIAVAGAVLANAGEELESEAALPSEQKMKYQPPPQRDSPSSIIKQTSCCCRIFK
jgi:hypothetical protein